MKLSDHFTLDEMIRSDTAVRKNIDNTPTDEIMSNLKVTAEGMEKVREILQVPITVTSGYRSPKLNKYIGGSKTSAHMLGYACDFIAPRFGNPLSIVTKLKAVGVSVDQCIMEGNWVHISFDPRMRQKYMTATFTNGIATYSDFK